MTFGLYTENGLKRTRFSVAKDMAKGIISNLSEGTTVSLIVFSSNVNIKYKNKILTNKDKENMNSEINNLKKKRAQIYVEHLIVL